LPLIGHGPHLRIREYPFAAGVNDESRYGQMQSSVISKHGRVRFALGRGVFEDLDHLVIEQLGNV
jgi:hypothetical protein